jgi:hypothetical protein
VTIILIIISYSLLFGISRYHSCLDNEYDLDKFLEVQKFFRECDTKDNEIMTNSYFGGQNAFSGEGKQDFNDFRKRQTMQKHQAWLWTKGKDLSYVTLRCGCGRRVRGGFIICNSNIKFDGNRFGEEFDVNRIL